MEFLMTIQPIAECLHTMSVSAWVMISLCLVVTGAFRFFALDEDGHILVKESWRRLGRAFIASLVLVLVLSPAAFAKEIFKNRIVYGAVTSNTAAHAVQTLDKLLDTIDKKLDEVNGHE
ncbi:MAG: hypothetical protein ACYTBJ_00360 [Planctomycetota bacterium]|jgi:hypothetical protein